MDKKVKVGLIQMESVLGDIKENQKKSLKLIKKSVKLGADIICLPEMFNTGYNLELLGDKIYKLAVSKDSKYVKKYQKIADENEISIILPITLKCDDLSIYNSALVINKNGNILGEYSKAHLFLHEKRFFQSGNKFKIFKLDGLKIGVLICYDLGFPEAARVLTLKGADIIFVPSAWRIEDYDIWDLNTKQRALENNLFICGVNRVGKEKDLHLFGNSRIVNPNGEIEKCAPKNEEAIVVKEIDISKVDKYRNYYKYLESRRNDLYGDFNIK